MQHMIEHLKWRYAVKRYDPSKMISRENMTMLLESIRLSPSSFGLQPYRVLFIEDPAIREKLSIASYNQPQIKEASCLVVFAIENNIDVAYVQSYFENLCHTRNISLEGNLLNHFESVNRSIQRMSEQEKSSWAMHQAYLALGFFLMAAAQLNIDANPMEGFIPGQYDEILSLTQKGLHAVVIAAIGYRSIDDHYQRLPKVRKPAEKLFIHI